LYALFAEIRQTAADVAREMAATAAADMSAPSEAEAMSSKDVPQSSGFGIITPVQKVT
jgi:hypothetical protein